MYLTVDVELLRSEIKLMHMPVYDFMANEHPQNLKETFAKFTVVSDSSKHRRLDQAYS